MTRTVSALAIELLMKLYYSPAGRVVEDSPAAAQVLMDFAVDGITNWRHGHTFGLTSKGREWAERILGTLPPRGYGAKAESFYLIRSDIAPYDTLGAARKGAIEDMQYKFIDSIYVLKPIERLERAEPQFKTTYLS